MKKKTLYVTDMDGTLLNSNSEISDQTAEILNRLIKEQEILFTVATARTPATVVKLMEKIDSITPYIVMAGGATWNNHTKQYDEVRTIDNEILDKILTIFSRHNIHPFVYRLHGNQILVHHVSPLTESEQQFIAPRITTPLKKLRLDERLNTDDPDRTILVFAMGQFDTLRNIANEIEEEKTTCSLNCYHDIFNKEQGILDIYTAGTTKASAIARLADKLGAERTVVFGDNLNDLPMMKQANYSIAVSNAFDEVKLHANEIIGSNDEDSVAHWIEKDVLTE